MSACWPMWTGRIRCPPTGWCWCRSPSPASTSWTSACARAWHGTRCPTRRSWASRALAVGEGVDGFEIGQRVAWVYAPGSYAQKIVIAGTSLVPIPDGIDDKTAASVPLSRLRNSLFRSGRHSWLDGRINAQCLFSLAHSANDRCCAPPTRCLNRHAR